MARMVSIFSAVVSLALTILFVMSFFMDWPPIESMLMKSFFLTLSLILTALSVSLLHQK